jgi:hypothetical protein
MVPYVQSPLMINSIFYEYYSLWQPDFSQYYDPSTYWQQTYGAWQGYYDQSNQTGEQQNYYQQAPIPTATGNGYTAAQMYEQPTEDDDLALVGKFRKKNLTIMKHNLQLFPIHAHESKNIILEFLKILIFSCHFNQDLGQNLWKGRGLTFFFYTLRHLSSQTS